jgi:hypothetical protein
MSQVPEQQETRLDTDIKRIAPFETAKRFAQIELGGKQMDVAVRRLDTPQPLLRSLGIRDIAAQRVGDLENEAKTEIADDIEVGEFEKAQQEAQRVMEQSKKEFQETNDVFHRAVSALLDRFPQSLFQVSDEGFNPAAIDGFLNTGAVGHKLAEAVSEGNVYLIAPDVKDELMSFLHEFQSGFINRAVKGSSEVYDTQTSRPFSPIERSIVPDELGFTMFFKRPDQHGNTVEHRIYFLFGNTAAENKNTSEDVDNAANTNTEQGEEEGLEKLDKAA